MLDKIVGLLKRRIYYKFTGIKIKRMRFFLHALQVSEHDWILDIGSADGAFWKSFWPAIWQPRVIGLDLYVPSNTKFFSHFVVADGLHLPFKDGAVNIVFSNSVIEHVGDYRAQRQMMDEIRRISSRYFVQVPAKTFPLEPHFLLPFIQYLAPGLRRGLTKTLLGRGDVIHLPARSDLPHIFGHCHIYQEKFWGITKSFYCWDRVRNRVYLQ